MQKLVVVRTNPEQGRPVKVQFRSGENELLGSGEFPFPLWLQFEKLVKDGLEGRARQEARDVRRIEVEFRPTGSGGVSEIAREEEEAAKPPVPVTLGVQKPLPVAPSTLSTQSQGSPPPPAPTKVEVKS